MTVKIKDAPHVQVHAQVHSHVSKAPSSSSLSVTNCNTNNANEAWNCICVAHAIRSFATRSWKFFLPLYLSQSCGSLRATAAMQLAKNLAVVTLSTAAANLYHTTPNSFVKATIMENMAVVAGGMLFSLFAHTSNEASCEAPFASTLFGIAIVCACLDAVCTSLLTTVISKEWVAALYPHSHNLASANARLSQIDLLAATLCPILVSTILEQAGYRTVLFLLVSQHAVGAFCILHNIDRAMHLKPHLAVIASASSLEKTAPKTSILVNPFCIFLDDVVPLKAKMVTAAFVLLYFTVLSAGAVMMSWLKSMHTNEHMIAWFGSACNLVGALATLLAPPLIRRVGNFKAGVIAQFGQCACCIVAMIAFYHRNDHITNNNHHPAATTAHMASFLIPVVASRIGVYVFDLVERQILQETVPRARQTLYFNTERGLRELALFGMMYLSYIYSKPESFGVLVNLSAAAGILSSLIMTMAMFV